ncbi:MAG: hypothetical protein AAFO74_01945 [Pseudomonadota bacterium]
MTRKYIPVALAALALPAAAETTPDEMLAPVDLSTPEAAVHSMMRAMYQGDAGMVDQVFHDSAVLRRVTSEGELRPDGLQRWRDWVGTLAVGQAYEELFAVETQQHGPLASVWAPFVITYQGELTGCGFNTLTLAQVGADWQIVYGMDTGAPSETCAGFKARYLEE